MSLFLEGNSDLLYLKVILLEIDSKKKKSIVYGKSWKKENAIGIRAY